MPLLLVPSTRQMQTTVPRMMVRVRRLRRRHAPSCLGRLRRTGGVWCVRFCCCYDAFAGGVSRRSTSHRERRGMWQRYRHERTSRGRSRQTDDVISRQPLRTSNFSRIYNMRHHDHDEFLARLRKGRGPENVWPSPPRRNLILQSCTRTATIKRKIFLEALVRPSNPANPSPASTSS
jgi:hypothetical protein